MGRVPNDSCAIARSVGVLGERWTFLILREAMVGTTRFSEIRKTLGIAPDVLTERLSTLVEHGVLRKTRYQQAGERARFSYELTPAGRDLTVILCALQQWGDEHLPWADGPSIVRRIAGTDRPVHVGFIDETGYEIDQGQVALIPTAVFPG